MTYTGILGAAGLAKESVLGTFVAPTEFVRFIPPFQFSDEIQLLESAGVSGIPDATTKVAQGPANLKAGKIKFEVEPENIGNHLMAAFGTDTPAEVATFTVTLNTNDYIDFTEDGGAELSAQLAAGTYIMGSSSAVAGSLCALIKTSLEAVNPSATYTVTYSYTTKKVTITKNGGVFVILWLTGTNNLKGAYALLGWAKADTASAIAQTSSSTTAQFAMTHAFTRILSASLPSYSWWQKPAGTLTYPEFAGCMLNKLEFDIKAKEYVTVDADWIGLKYVAGGTTQSTSYSTLNPFTFEQAVVSIAGTPSVDLEECKLTIDNMVEAVHVVGNTINASKIYSKGFKVSLQATIIVEDTVEWAKFIAGTSSSFTIVITSTQAVVGTTYYKLTLTMTNVQYKAAPFPIAKDLIKITFTADAFSAVASSTTLTAALVNTVGAAY